MAPCQDHVATHVDDVDDNDDDDDNNGDDDDRIF